jgi:hypothetical protein|uniref:Rad50 zinc hook motif n=1 Tax=Myoviridae sp. ctshb19 TaxID=2825194 RepID=A0A8S5UGL0_9CAUD|nr:MAG TPA: Rad50 zinc hook motif [Myoviridae sp. ctshb19]
MTKQCKPGTCIVGEIQNVAICERDWMKKATAFQKVIADWNEKTKRFAVPHPGFCYRSNYCAMCGRPLAKFHEANDYLKDTP